MAESAISNADVDLATTYLGLPLRTPLVASSGPLTGRIEPLQALQDNGIAAVVLPSLFAEQLGGQAADDATASYFIDVEPPAGVGERYLRHVREASGALDVPVIGSLNGVAAGDWMRYAPRIADAGADALELNLYAVVTDVAATAADIESSQLAIVEQIKRSLTIPLAVKVSPYYTAFASMARRLVDAGADGLVLFNRFYQPDIDPDTGDATHWLELSRQAELRLPLRWSAILSERLDVSLAVSGGVHHAPDVARALLAGADAAMMTSVLIDQGPVHVGLVEADLATWVSDRGHTSVAALAGTSDGGTMSEREAYIRTLVTYTTSFHDGWGFNPY